MIITPDRGGICIKVHEIAKISGISVRTLQYYDNLGLLKPAEVTSRGYRIYNQDSLRQLQQILFFRELDFPLKQIKEIITSPDFDQRETLKSHRNLLTKKRDRLTQLIQLTDTLIETKEQVMPSFKEFDTTNIAEAKQQYAQEAKDRWGTSMAYRESSKKTAQYNKEQWQLIQQESSSIFQGFAELRSQPASTPKTQQLVEAWRNHITKWFYQCSVEILKGLGEMYAEDPRFCKNIDTYGEGTAVYMAEAISIYCDQQA